MHNRQNLISAAVALIATLAVSAGPAAAQIPTAILTEITGSPTEVLPGGAGIFDDFDGIGFSPNGSRWILFGNREGGDAIALTGNGATPVSVVGTSGSSAPFATTPGSMVTSLSSDQGGINDSGQFALRMSTGEVTGINSYVVTGDGVGPLSVAAQRGAPAPSIAGGHYFNFRSTHILNDGRVSFADSSLRDAAGLTLMDGAGNAVNRAVFQGTGPGQSLLGQRNVTVPLPQINVPTEAWNDFDDGYSSNADGTSTIVAGAINASFPNDPIVAVDGIVVMQGPEDFGGRLTSGFTITSEVSMNASGDWMVFGETDNEEFVVLNGFPVAIGDQPLFAGSGANWEGFRFENMAANNLGDFIVSGRDDSAASSFDEVMVFNNLEVVLREGDGVDIDGNGLLDDGAFIGGILANSAFLTDGRQMYVAVLLEDITGAGLGEAFITTVVPEPGMLGLLAFAGLALLRRRGSK